MGTVISFFRMAWDGLIQMLNWLKSIPAILIASVIGFSTTVTSLVSSLSSESTSVVTEAVTTASQPIATFYSIVQSMPDVVKLGFYCVSLDVLYRFVLAAFMLFVGGMVLVLEFQLVSVLGFVASVYVFKIAAWVINAFFPNSFSIGGIKSVASADVPQVGMGDVIDV